MDTLTNTPRVMFKSLAGGSIAQYLTLVERDRPETIGAHIAQDKARIDRVPCGGTHVRSTGEIGQIKLKRKNIGKGKERVEVFSV